LSQNTQHEIDQLRKDLLGVQTENQRLTQDKNLAEGKLKDALHAHQEGVHTLEAQIRFLSVKYEGQMEAMRKQSSDTESKLNLEL
jgi:hypothetical protein